MFSTAVTGGSNASHPDATIAEPVPSVAVSDKAAPSSMAVGCEAAPIVGVGPFVPVAIGAVHPVTVVPDSAIVNEDGELRIDHFGSGAERTPSPPRRLALEDATVPPTPAGRPFDSNESLPIPLKLPIAADRITKSAATSSTSRVTKAVTPVALKDFIVLVIHPSPRLPAVCGGRTHVGKYRHNVGKDNRAHLPSLLGVQIFQFLVRLVLRT